MIKLIKVILIISLSLSLVSAKDTFVNLLSDQSQVSQIGFFSVKITIKQNSTGYLFRNLNNGTLTLNNVTSGKEILNIKSSEEILFSNHLVFDTKNLDLIMKYPDSEFIMDDTSQWTLLFLDDFQGNPNGFSKDKLSTCGSNDNMFLGGHCNFGGIEVFKIYKNLPKHKKV